MHVKLLQATDPMAVALDYSDTVNRNIELLLIDKTKKLEVDLKNIEHDFCIFWKFIGAEGNLDAALTELKISIMLQRIPT